MCDVLKQVTPLSALKLAEIFRECGLPDGVFNVVQGTGKDVGQALVTHKDVAKVSLTGSVPSGKKVAALAGENLKKVRVVCVCLLRRYIVEQAG